MKYFLFEIWRSAKRIALSKKKATFKSARTLFKKVIYNVQKWVNIFQLFWSTIQSCFAFLECQHLQIAATVESSSLVAWNLKKGKITHLNSYGMAKLVPHNKRLKRQTVVTKSSSCRCSIHFWVKKFVDSKFVKPSDSRSKDYEPLT